MLERPARKDEERIAAWVRPGTSLFYFHHQERIYGVPAELAADLPILQSSLYLKRAGAPLGKLSVKEFIPEHDLALSTLISPALPALSLSRDDAVRYLRKDEWRPTVTLIRDGEWRSMGE